MDTKTPGVTEHEMLSYSVEHFCEKVKTNPDWMNNSNKELWAISQIYRSWEVHKKQCNEARHPPRYNNDHIIAEVSKRYAIIPQEELDGLRKLLWEDGYSDKSLHIQIIEKYLHPDLK